MVQLLDLPNEILQVIMKHAVMDPYRPNVKFTRRLPRNILSAALSLRLVRSRFASIAASIIFAKRKVTLAHRDPVSMSHEPVLSYALKVFSTPSLGQHVRCLHVRLDEATVPRFSDLYEVLRCVLPFVRRLVIETRAPRTAFMWTQTDQLPHAPHLRELLLLDDQPVYLPHILLAATALQTFEMRAPIGKPEYNVQYPASCRNVQPIPQVIIDGFGHRNVQRFLQAMELRTKSLVLLNQGGRWHGSTEEHVAALSSLAECEALAEVYVRYGEYFFRCHPNQYSVDKIVSHLEGCGLQRARLYEYLKETCANQDVVLSFDTIREDWQEVLAKEVLPMVIGLLKETRRVTSRKADAEQEATACGT